MTRHPYTPECDCNHCYVDSLNAVLRRFLEQREKGKPPVEPDAEQLDYPDALDELFRGVA